MTSSRLLGSALLASSLSLFAVLIYEPDNIVRFFGLEPLMDEASVVLVCLFLVAALAAGGAAALRFERPPAEDVPSR